MKFKTALLVALVFVTLFWPFIFGFGLVAGIVALADSDSETVSGLEYETYWGDESSDQLLLSIPINGPMYDDPADWSSVISWFGGGASYSQVIRTVLEEAADDPDIAGVVFEINSPGGTVTSAHSIVDAIYQYKSETNKPVLVHANGLLASGAYWVAAAADSITVNPGTLVGSIGVISGQVLEYSDVTELYQGFGQGVVTENGISLEYITAGEGKAAGNPFTPLTEEERQVAQTSADNTYTEMVEFIANRRGLSQDYVRDQVGAYVYDDITAGNLDLINQRGFKDQTYQQLAEMADLGSDYRVVRATSSMSFIEMLLYAALPEETIIPESSFSCKPQAVYAYYGDLSQFCGR